MHTRYGARTWAIGGVLGAAALLAIAWFLLINPTKSDASSLQEQTDTASLSVPVLQRKLNELRTQNNDLNKYQDELDRDRLALPTTADLSTFLDDLQSTGVSAGVSVGAVTVGPPTQATPDGGRILALPVNVSANGNPKALNRFVDQLQQVQPRAVLISNASLTTDAGGATLTLSLQVFVAPSANATTASRLASPSAKTG